jgi:acyl-CoA thioesterase-1
LAEQHHLPLVPFLLKNVAEHENLMQADRYHPKARAQPLILDNVWPELLQLLQTLP